MSKLRWWAIYRGEEFVDWALAKSGESAIATASQKLGIALAELDAEEFDLPKMELPLTPQLLREPVPTMRAVPWAQTEARLEARREPGPAVPGEEVV